MTEAIWDNAAATDERYTAPGVPARLPFLEMGIFSIQPKPKTKYTNLPFALAVIDTRMLGKMRINCQN